MDEADKQNNPDSDNTVRDETRLKRKTDRLMTKKQAARTVKAE